MKQQDVEEIIQCLPKGRTLFPYFRDRYATLLLAWLCQEGRTISEIKKSRYSGLLNKQLIKEAISGCGDGTISAQSLDLVWPETSENFLLTLGRWGGDCWRWQQTTRPGYNLVLQVNMHEGYRRWFNQTVPENQRWRFSTIGHPVLEPGTRSFYRTTLGWVRLDIDFKTGEVLIEEIQTDWLRDLQSLLRYTETAIPAPEAEVLIHYCQVMLARLGSMSDEVLLSAALWFAHEELGMADIWYHTFDSGCRLKRIRGCRPPRSLYTRLPKRFCFELTDEQPQFLLQDKKFRKTMRKKPAPQWHRLKLQ